jgi:hypothetical protein
MADWDVQKAKIFGLFRQSTEIESFRNLVDRVMHQQQYCFARRGFWLPIAVLRTEDKHLSIV